MIFANRGMVMDIVKIIQTILLGIIQGITEWLPVSSTGHMLLFDSLWPMTGVSKEFMDTFKVVIQFGSILAVVVLYFEKLNPFSGKKSIEQRKNTWTLWYKVAVASIPAAVFGFLFEDMIDNVLSENYVIAVTLILYGIGFIIMENINRRAVFNDVIDFTFKTAFIIGMFQVLALIPGTSRSGATIIGAVAIGCSRAAAAEFSFFLAVPVMLGASGFKLLKSGFSFAAHEWAILILGMVVAFIVSVVAIKFLMGYIRKHDFKAFGWYRIILGIVVLLYFYVII